MFLSMEAASLTSMKCELPKFPDEPSYNGRGNLANQPLNSLVFTCQAHSELWFIVKK